MRTVVEIHTREPILPAKRNSSRLSGAINKICRITSKILSSAIVANSRITNDTESRRNADAAVTKPPPSHHHAAFRYLLTNAHFNVLHPPTRNDYWIRTRDTIRFRPFISDSDTDSVPMSRLQRRADTTLSWRIRMFTTSAGPPIPLNNSIQ